MAGACETHDENEEIIYQFRFNTSDKIIHISEQQLDRIPYLSALIIHKNDFSSIQNENDEYVLNSQIRYDWFMPIFQSVMTQHPSVLFTELPREVSVWGMLQLYEYLCIDPISIPLLKNQHLLQLNSNTTIDENSSIQYIRANNLLEVRDIAVQFIIILTKNEYNLDDSQTLRNIFSLIIVILSNPNIFGLRICYHTLTVTKKLYFSLFSYKQQCHFKNIEESLQNIKARSFKCLYSDEEKLPEHFQNAFAWKGVYTVIERTDGINRSSDCDKEFISDEILFQIPFLDDLNLDMLPDYELMWNFPITSFDIPLLSPLSVYYGNAWFVRDRIAIRFEEERLRLTHRSSMLRHNLYNFLFGLREQESLMINKEQKKIEAHSARSGYFNTVPKRPKVDKFKHRCGPKAQKYR